MAQRTVSQKQPGRRAQIQEQLKAKTNDGAPPVWRSCAVYCLKT